MSPDVSLHLHDFDRRDLAQPLHQARELVRRVHDYHEVESWYEREARAFEQPTRVARRRGQDDWDAAIQKHLEESFAEP